MNLIPVGDDVKARYAGLKCLCGKRYFVLLHRNLGGTAERTIFGVYYQYDIFIRPCIFRDGFFAPQSPEAGTVCINTVPVHLRKEIA